MALMCLKPFLGIVCKYMNMGVALFTNYMHDLLIALYFFLLLLLQIGQIQVS